jgi:DNA-directed RNA polymerase
MRNSITEITRTIPQENIKIHLEHELSFKRTPSNEEVKEYHAKLKEIAQDLYKHNIDNMMDGNASSTQPGIKLIKKYVWTLAEEIEEILEGVKGVSNLKPLIQYATLTPNKGDDFSSRCKELALMGLTHVLNAAMSPETNGITGDAYSEVVKRIGKQFTKSVLEDYHRQEKRTAYENKQAKKKDASVRSYKPKSIEKIKIEILGRKAWSDEDQARKELEIKSGAVLLNLVIDLADFATIEKRRVSKNSKYFRNIEIKPEVMEEVTEMISQSVSQADYYAPDIAKPKSWIDQARNKKKLVRNSNYKKYKEGEIVDHVAKIDKALHSREEMPRVFDVLDIVESVEWTVDADMINTIRECIDAGISIPGINEVVNIPVKPPTMWDFAKNDKTPRKPNQDESQEDYAEYNEDAKHVKEDELLQWWENFYFDLEGLKKAFESYRKVNSHLFEEGAIFEGREDKELAGEWYKSYKKKVSNDSKCAAGMRSIETADQLKEYKEIFFAHNLDTRGRLYPIATSLNPQLNDVSKGLLKFAEGDVVDEEALGWLEVNLANNWANEVEIELTDEELMNEIEFIQQFV